MFATSPLLDSVPGIRYGFGTARHLVPASLSPHWQAVPSKLQVHGVNVVEITHAGQQCEDADAFFTSVAGIPVTVITADCVPLLFARRDGKMIAVAHAGWRGLRYGVIRALWDTLKARGEDPADWVAAIGAHIGACCFEVSENLADEFVQHLAHVPASDIRPRHRHLNLNAIAELELRAAGIVNFDNPRICTMCQRQHDGRFAYRSYRRGDRNSHQHTGLVIV